MVLEVSYISGVDRCRGGKNKLYSVSNSGAISGSDWTPLVLKCALHTWPCPPLYVCVVFFAQRIRLVFPGNDLSGSSM